MKTLIIAMFVIDVLLLAGITMSESGAGDVELHVTLMRLVIEAAALAALKEMRK